MPRQGGRRLLHRGSDLEQVAHDERDRETRRGSLPAAEGERHDEAVLVHAVQQPPQAVARTDHASSREGAAGGDPLEEIRVVVVVAHQRSLLAGQHGLGAAWQECRRVPHGQHPRCHLVAPRQRDEPLPRRYQLGHEPSELRSGCGEVGALKLALLEVPAPVARPGRVVQRLPASPRDVLVNAVHGVGQGRQRVAGSSRRRYALGMRWQPRTTSSGRLPSPGSRTTPRRPRARRGHRGTIVWPAPASRR